MEVLRDEIHEKHYTFFVDEKEFHAEKSHLTGGEIMDIAGIPRATGIVQISEDGSQNQVSENEVIELEGHDRRFKKPPKFKRGSR